MAKRRPISRGGSPHSGGLVDVESRRLQIARSLWNEGRRKDALDLYHEAIRQEPDNVRTYIMAARTHAEIFDFRRMEELHERVRKRAPRHPGVHHYLGETYASLKLPARAIACFETAARLPGAGPPTWMELAALHERGHRLDEAEAMIERTVQSGFDHPLVPLVRGRIQRRLKRIVDAEATFQDFVGRYPPSPWTCEAWSEIALIKDKQGDYDGAIAAIERCKEAQRTQEGPYWKASERVHAEMRELIDALSGDDFRRWRAEAADREPRRLATLCGFPRSGTTLLEQVLDAHPDLVSSEERDFVGRELMHTITSRRGKATLLETLARVRPEQIEAERERYLGAMEFLLGEPIGGRIHLDKNPAYNLMIPFILRFFPEMRFVVALRDPRDVVVSCYLRYLPLNAVSVRFLSLARTADRYALDMSAWLRYRETSGAPWIEVRYEDTVRDLAGQARRALDALGLPWSDEVLGYRERLLESKQVTSPTYEAVAQPIHSGAIGRWKNYARHLEPVMGTLEPFVREFGYG